MQQKKFLKWKSHHKNAVSLLIDLGFLDLKIYMLLQMFL